MRFTLSHSRVSTSERVGGPRTTVCVTGLGLAVIAAAMTLSCHRAEISDSENASARATGDSDAVRPIKSAQEFVWPDDPNHPLLTIEIESHTRRGTITIELMPELAPDTVARVIELATDGYYDGTTFHRVIPGFMIQGGDPNSRDRDPRNDGKGNPDLTIPDEFCDAPFVRGVVGMGNKGRKNSTGGQFFIMHADNDNLNGRYTIIGRVHRGLEMVDEIMTVPIDRIGRWGPRDRPIENVVMTKVDIEESTRPADTSDESTNQGDSSLNSLAEL